MNETEKTLKVSQKGSPPRDILVIFWKTYFQYHKKFVISKYKRIMCDHISNVVRPQ